MQERLYSQTFVEDLIGRLYAARFSNDVEGVLACMAPGSTFTMVGTLPSGQPVPPLQGHAAQRARFLGLFQRWSWQGMRITRTIIGREGAAIEIAGEMLDCATGNRFQTEICDVLVIRDGLVESAREYVDTFLMARVAGIVP